MKRDLGRLSTESFDVIVVGGGILGAFVSLLAEMRGLRVALLEKEDFASGTTSGSGKVLHGGVRYLQQMRLGLARKAQQEQQRLAEAAASLVRPLPFLVPAREGQLREDLVVRAGPWIWNAFTKITAGGAAPPRARHLTGEGVRDLMPELGGEFRGGMLFHDVQLRSPERLTYEVVRRAAEFGAVVANYAEVAGVRVGPAGVGGVDVRDVLTGNSYHADAPIVVNAGGAWAPGISPGPKDRLPDIALGKGIHVVLDRSEPPVALALPLRGQGGTDPTTSEERRVFLMPWEDRTLLGASYTPFEESPDQASVSADEVSNFIGRLQSQWPRLELRQDEIVYAYSGLYPVFGQSELSEDRYEASLYPLIVDHGDRGGASGLFTAVSVKMTTARALAERIVRRIASHRDCAGKGLSPDQDGRSLPSLGPTIDASRLGDPGHLPSVAREAARNEMAVKLSDVLFRRSWIGHLGHPGTARLQDAASAMARVHGWSAEEAERQVREIDELYGGLGATVPAGTGTCRESDRN